MSGKYKEFGSKLRKYREKKGYSIKQLAQILNKSPGTINNWELGGQLPSTQCIITCIEKLEIDTNDLFSAYLKSENQLFLKLLSNLKKIKMSKNPDHWNVVKLVIQLAMEVIEDEKKGTFKHPQQGAEGGEISDREESA